MHSWNIKDRQRMELERRLQAEQRRYAAMSPEQRKAHNEAQLADLERRTRAHGGKDG